MTKTSKPFNLGPTLVACSLILLAGNVIAQINQSRLAEETMRKAKGNLPVIVNKDVTLELDPARGVLYVTSLKSGKTLLRVSNIPVEVTLVDPETGGMIDVRADKTGSGQAPTN